MAHGAYGRGSLTCSHPFSHSLHFYQVVVVDIQTPALSTHWSFPHSQGCLSAKHRKVIRKWAGKTAEYIQFGWLIRAKLQGRLVGELWEGARLDRIYHFIQLVSFINFIGWAVIVFWDSMYVLTSGSITVTRVCKHFSYCVTFLLNIFMDSALERLKKDWLYMASWVSSFSWLDWSGLIATTAWWSHSCQSGAGVLAVYHAYLLTFWINK